MSILISFLTLLPFVAVLSAAPTPPAGAAPATLDVEADSSSRIELISPKARARRQALLQMPGKSGAIRIGEKLTFSVRYGMIRAGEATMEIAGIDTIRGRPCYHVVSKAKSNNVFDAIYKVRDRVESWMDADLLFSRQFRKNLREGSYRTDQEIEMDQETGLARYQDGRVFELTAGAHDVLSAFYFVRTQHLEPGQEFNLDSHADRKNVPLLIRVHGRQRVETPAGKFDCIVVEPMLRSPGLFKHEGSLTIWLTDDARRMPVIMKSKIPVGSISVILTDYRATYGSAAVTKDDIFYYVYGILHSPAYRIEFASDLKKMLPRIPKVTDFAGFAAAASQD